MKQVIQSTLLSSTHGGEPGQDVPSAIFARALQSIRRHLGMDVAFISEFSGGRRYFRHVSAAPGDDRIRVGASDPLEDSYCEQVVDGRLAGRIADASADPVASALRATHAMGIGAHLGVPIVLADGSVFGTFCCFSTTPDHTLTDRDLAVMRVFAEVVGDQIDRDLSVQEEQQAVTRRIDAVLDSSGLEIVYQPIVMIDSGRVVGFEALSRFTAPPARTPDVWFAEAARVGLGVELEALAIGRALEGLWRLPESVYVAINASPATVVEGRLARLLTGIRLERVVVEVTEHEAVERYDELVAAVRPLQDDGLRIAIDDAGAGYASFRHILNLAPHMIKLDVSITRGIDGDRSRRALAAALCRFAEETGCRIVAEGVETAGELRALRELGFSKAQGYFLGRPMSLDQAVARCGHAEPPLPG